MKVRFGEIVVIWNGEMEYEGSHKKYVPDGKGKVKKGNDVMMDGEFVKGKFVKGKMELLVKNDEKYQFEGNLVKSLMIKWNAYPVREISGKGKWMKAGNGDKEYYKGDIVNNKRHGRGKLFEKHNDEWRIVYDGEWRDDSFNGTGKLITNEGNIYEGDFVNGKLLGGKLTMKNGVVYEGEFENGKMAGKGVIDRKSVV